MSGLTACMNHQDCLGEHRVCSHQDMNLVGECVCQEGYTQVDQNSVACAKRGRFFYKQLRKYESLCKCFV